MQDTELVTQEESKKTYRALLQNQVLGIDNPYLLNEIHNSEDFLQKENLYSQMQQNAENMDFMGSGLVSSPPMYCGASSSSPYRNSGSAASDGQG